MWLWTSQWLGALWREKCQLYNNLPYTLFLLKPHLRSCLIPPTWNTISPVYCTDGQITLFWCLPHWHYRPQRMSTQTRRPRTSMLEQIFVFADPSNNSDKIKWWIDCLSKLPYLVWKMSFKSLRCQVEGESKGHFKLFTRRGSYYKVYVKQYTINS